MLAILFYIKDGDFRQIIERLPLCSQIFQIAHDNDMFQLMIVEIRGSESRSSIYHCDEGGVEPQRHYEIPQADERRIFISEQTHNHMAI